MSDFTLAGGLELDTDALDDVQNRNLSMAGGGFSDDQQELDEERNERLQQVNRGTSRIVGKLGFLGVIAGSLALLAKTVGNIFDISFSDLRSGIVEVLTDLANGFKKFITGIPGGLSKQVVGEDTTNRLQSAAFGGMFGFPGMVAGGALNFMDNSGTSESSNQNMNLDLVTSRDKILGDSTQQEMMSQQESYNILRGGS